MAIESQILIFGIITALVLIPLSALLLWLSSKIFSLKNQSYKTAIFIAAIITVVNYIINLIISAITGYNTSVASNPLALVAETLAYIILIWIFVSFLLAWGLIKIKYELEWGKAFLVWLVWAVFNFILGLLISVIFAGILISQI